MPGRRDLLDAARRCLVTRGWGATTVRDVAAEAGMSHAAIGYHFGSRDALMAEALVEAVAELGEQVDPDGKPQQQAADLLATVESRPELWLAQLEAIRQAHGDPEVRRALLRGQRAAREGLGGALPQALLLGLAVQRLLDAADVPDAATVDRALRYLRGMPH